MSGRRKRESHIRLSRERNGVGVRELARRLDVSPASVVDWERSEERGTAQLNTIERALEAMGEQFVAGSRRVTGNDESDVLDRREERVALELHRAVATKLLENPSAVLSVVPSNIERLRRVVRGAAAESWLDEWANLADQRRVGALIDVMLGTDRRSVDMRQTSPFLGVLTKDERVAAISRAAA